MTFTLHRECSAFRTTCLFVLLLSTTTFAQENNPAQTEGESQDSDPSISQPVRRVDGYKGIWFTLGQFYGEGSDGQAYSGVSRTPVFPYGDKYSGGPWQNRSPAKAHETTTIFDDHLMRKIHFLRFGLMVIQLN